MGPLNPPRVAPVVPCGSTLLLCGCSRTHACKKARAMFSPIIDRCRMMVHFQAGIRALERLAAQAARRPEALAKCKASLERLKRAEIERARIERHHAVRKRSCTLSDAVRDLKAKNRAALARARAPLKYSSRSTGSDGSAVLYCAGHNGPEL